MTLEQLQEKYADREPVFPAQLPKPAKEDLAEIERKYGCKYPESFVQFQLAYFDKIPMGEFAFDGFGWANKNYEPYMNLEEIVKDYRELDFPDYLSPFRVDNGDFWCFDTRYPNGDGEYPVVIWSHNDNGIEKDPAYRWGHFVDWLDKTMDE